MTFFNLQITFDRNFIFITFRVLKPPGGGQSNIFGSPQAPVHSPKKGEENVLTQPKSPIKSVENIENQIKTGENKIEKAPEVKAPMPKTDSYKQRHQGF